MPARPKQQHYVTRAYLEGFLEPAQEHLYCYGRNRPEPFQSQPTDLARRQSYYSVRRADGTWDDSLEHRIEERVETPGLEILRKLSSGNTRLDWPQRIALAMLMAVQRFRVPHLREIIDAAHAGFVQALLLEYDQRQREQGPSRMWIRNVHPLNPQGDQEGPRAYVSREELEEMRRSLEEDPGQFSRQTLFNQALSFARAFARMKWTVHYSGGDAPFITSDCPVLLRHERTDIEQAGILRPDSQIEFPLSRTSLLAMTHDLDLINRISRLGMTRETRRMLQRVPEVRVSQATTEQVEAFNRNQAEYCSHWTFSGHRNDWLIDALRGRSKNVHYRMVRDGDLFRLDALRG